MRQPLGRRAAVGSAPLRGGLLGPGPDVRRRRGGRRRAGPPHDYRPSGIGTPGSGGIDSRVVFGVFQLTSSPLEFLGERDERGEAGAMLRDQAFEGEFPQRSDLAVQAALIFGDAPGPTVDRDDDGRGQRTGPSGGRRPGGLRRTGCTSPAAPASEAAGRRRRRGRASGRAATDATCKAGRGRHGPAGRALSPRRRTARGSRVGAA